MAVRILSESSVIRLDKAGKNCWLSAVKNAGYFFQEWEALERCGMIAL